jgi:hypothetical protein
MGFYQRLAEDGGGEELKKVSRLLGEGSSWLREILK